jgi:hypothetical protein
MGDMGVNGEREYFNSTFGNRGAEIGDFLERDDKENVDSNI